jgi:hypothetical protein
MMEENTAARRASEFVFDFLIPIIRSGGIM